MTSRTLGKYLEFQRYRLITAATGEQAYEQARVDRPDIILLDLRMPGIDGVQTLHLLRSDPLLADVPIVALTALAMDAHRTRALAGGSTHSFPSRAFPPMSPTIQGVLAARLSRRTSDLRL